MRRAHGLHFIRSKGKKRREPGGEEREKAGKIE
jgi:hypothetical protein